MESLFVLVHSPLVGPFTWALVADDLRRRGHGVLVPELENPSEAPFWRRHADSVARALADLPADEPVALVGHSGAGPLLPGIAQAAARVVAAYIFVDAGLPAGGESHIGAGDFAAYLRDLYAGGGRYPNWRDEDLRELVPDPALRSRVLSELRPQPLAFWEEMLPAVDEWPDAPAVYLQFTSAYDAAAEQARCLGWPYRCLQGGHFHMLVDPTAVTDVLLELADVTAAREGGRGAPFESDNR